MIEIPIIHALCAAFFVGTGNFLVRFSAAKRAPIYTVAWVMVFGTIALGSLLIYRDQFTFIQSWDVTLLIIIASFSSFFALICLFRSLTWGPIYLAAPLAETGTVWLALEWLLMGVNIGFYGYIGLIVAVIGVMFISYCSKRVRKSYDPKYYYRTAFFALLAGFFFALRLFILQICSEDIGILNGLFQIRFFGIFITVVFLLFLLTKKRINLPKKGDFHWRCDVIIPFSQVALETIGFILLLYASIGDYRVIAPTIYTSLSIVTIFWSMIFFSERLSLYVLLVLLFY